MERDGLADGGLYYGPEPEAAPAPALRVRLDGATAAFFERLRPYDPGDAGALGWGGEAWPLLFPLRHAGPPEAGGVVEADPFASAFLWLSGWHEAATVARDRHGRFPYAHSLQAMLDSLPSRSGARGSFPAPTVRRPVVDAYRAWLGERLAARGVRAPGRTWGGRSWAVAVTADVDAVRMRWAGRALGALRTRRLTPLTAPDARRALLSRFHAALVRRAEAPTFFLKAAARAPEDAPYALSHPALAPLLADARAGRVEVGLHPSYFAHDHAGHLAAERAALAGAGLARAAGPLTSVRAHYLRWAEPATPRLLDAAGFRLDSTLGFAEAAGFRRGTAAPFRLYDLVADRPLGLWELPLAVMDTTLLVHRGLDAEAAWAEVEAVLAAARRVGGCAVLLWHNEPMGAGHAALLDRALGAAQAGGALVAGLGRALEAWRA